MVAFVTAADAVRFAVEIERKGYAFYCSAQEKAVGQEDKDFFAFMAQEEKRHEGIFTALLSRVEKISAPQELDEAELHDYTHALIDSHCLFLADQGDAAQHNPLGLAMQFEKDSLLFFIALEDMVPPAEKQYVRHCADEERRHIQMLAKRMAGKA